MANGLSDDDWSGDYELDVMPNSQTPEDNPNSRGMVGYVCLANNSPPEDWSGDDELDEMPNTRRPLRLDRSDSHGMWGLANTSPPEDWSDDYELSVPVYHIPEEMVRQSNLQPVDGGEGQANAVADHEPDHDISNDSEVVPFDTFTRFPDLPAELRVKIWKFAEPGPRIVILRLKTQEVNDGINIIGTESRTPVPALLHTNVESREEMKKTYQLSFGFGARFGCEPISNPRVYFNFERDTLCWESIDMLWTDPSSNSGTQDNEVIHHVLGPDRSRLRRLVLLERCQYLHYFGMPQLCFDKTLFDSLDHITVVLFPFNTLPLDFKINILQHLTAGYQGLHDLMRHHFPQVAFPTMDCGLVDTYSESAYNERLTVLMAENNAERVRRNLPIMFAANNLPPPPPPPPSSVPLDRSPHTLGGFILLVCLLCIVLLKEIKSA